MTAYTLIKILKKTMAHTYNLRKRKPKRTDPLLMSIYDALPEELLRVIAYRAIYMRRHQYRTRSSLCVFF